MDGEMKENVSTLRLSKLCHIFNATQLHSEHHHAGTIYRAIFIFFFQLSQIHVLEMEKGQEMVCFFIFLAKASWACFCFFHAICKRLETETFRLAHFFHSVTIKWKIDDCPMFQTFPRHCHHSKGMSFGIKVDLSNIIGTPHMKFPNQT